MTDKPKPEELNEAELDQVTGGAGGKALIAHELTHVQQQGGDGLTILTSNQRADIDGGKVAPGSRVEGIGKSGGGSDI